MSNGTIAFMECYSPRVCVSYNNARADQPDSWSNILKLLEKQDYKIDIIKEDLSSRLGEKYNLIIIPGVTKQISELDIAILENYILNGGSLLICHDAGGDEDYDTNINRLLRKLGAEFANLDLLWGEEVYKLTDPPQEWIKRPLIKIGIGNNTYDLFYWGCTIKLRKISKNTEFTDSKLKNVIVSSKELSKASNIHYSRKYPCKVEEDPEERDVDSKLACVKLEVIRKGGSNAILSNVTLFGGKYCFDNTSIPKPEIDAKIKITQLDKNAKKEVNHAKVFLELVEITKSKEGTTLSFPYDKEAKYRILDWLAQKTEIEKQLINLLFGGIVAGIISGSLISVITAIFQPYSLYYIVFVVCVLVFSLVFLVRWLK